MHIIKLQVGQLGTNCYIVFCPETRQGVVIDPGGNGDEIVAILHREKLQVAYVVNTHGHADHIADNDKVCQAMGAQVAIHERDAGMLTSEQRNLSVFIGNPVVCEPAGRLLKDGEVFAVGTISFKVLYTPGHTPGGICLLAKDVLLAGDTLFAGSIGRTDFPEGSYSQLIGSIKDKILVLPDHVKVLPGHGPDTTIGDERAMNPFIQ